MTAWEHPQEEAGYRRWAGVRLRFADSAVPARIDER
jgi:hypothetical protein